MQIRRFLEWAGVDYEALWPEDAATRLQYEAESLQRNVNRLRMRLIASKRRILAIRARIEAVERGAESQPLDRLRFNLNGAENRYEYWLARWTRANGRLLRLRRNLLAVLQTRSSQVKTRRRELDQADVTSAVRIAHTS